jgi:hypothetical protein
MKPSTYQRYESYKAFCALLGKCALSFSEWRWQAMVLGIESR